jgi:hypothetical protein
MLDQKVPTARTIAQQYGDLFGGLRIGLTSFGGRLRPFSSFPWMIERADLVHVMTHGCVSFSLIL